MKNVELVVKMFEKAEIRWVFGVPSGPVLPLIEALRASSLVDYVLTASETSAAFMAETVGRLTGIPGVCASTVGPGATNLATGVGGAWLDRSPVIAITCNYATQWLHRRTQMLIDHQALFAPLTKASWRLEQGHIAEKLARALTLAVAEPPGPVHLDFPQDIGEGPATEDLPAFPISNTVAAQGEAIGSRVLDLLKSARRPLIVTGLTFTRSRAASSLLRFIETQGIPFVSTLHGKGFLPESHPAALGVMGRACSKDVQRIMALADLYLCVGFDPVEINYEEWCGKTPVIHLSTEPADVDDRLCLALDAAGNLDGWIAELADLPRVSNDWRAKEWSGHREKLDKALRPTSERMAASHVLDILKARLPEDAILCYDVGAHTHQIATQWRTDRPHTCLATNGWSCMGYGMPAAYAAKLVYPGRTVVGVIGDGCFQMTVGELATARRLRLSVPVIVLNDGWLGLMKVKQERLHYNYYGSFLGEPTDSPSHYFGVPVRGVRDVRALQEALEWALHLDGPCVIEAFIDVQPYSLTVFDK